MTEINTEPGAIAKNEILNYIKVNLSTQYCSTSLLFCLYKKKTKKKNHDLNCIFSRGKRKAATSTNI